MTTNETTAGDISPQNSSDAGNARQSAVDFAIAQIGKPYVFGAAGPSAYDCSGLTMMAWRAAGFSTLTHSAAAQLHEGMQIPVAQMQPGDLMFVGPDSRASGEPHHVALCVGSGGAIIEAYDVGYPIRQNNISEYARKGLNPMAVQMPAGGGDYVVGDATQTAVSSGSGASSLLGFSNFLGLGSVSKLIGYVTNVDNWKRLGMMALGAVILIALFKWMVDNA